MQWLIDIIGSPEGLAFIALVVGGIAGHLNAWFPTDSKYTFITTALLWFANWLKKQGGSAAILLAVVAALLLSAGSARADDSPPASCVTVFAPPNWAGCGTCVACEDGRSLVVTCKHVFSDQHHPQGGFRDDIYPVRCKVSRGSSLSAPRLDAVAVAGDRAADLVLVIVDAKLPVSELADDVPPARSTVWRFGHGTGAVRTRVSGAPSAFAEPRFGFRAEGNSESGDSGAGYFNEKWELCAVHCGKDDDYPRGTPVKAVRAFLDKHRAKVKAKDAAKELPKELPKAKSGKGVCICGDGCKCKDGVCPACPVAQKPKAAPAVEQYRWEYVGTDRWGRRVYQLVPASRVPMAMPSAAPQSCPNGNCPAPNLTPRRGLGIFR